MMQRMLRAIGLVGVLLLMATLLTPHRVAWSVGSGGEGDEIAVDYPIA